MKVKSESEVTQSCPTRSDPMDHSLPGSSVHGIFQARILEWGAIAFSCMMQPGEKKIFRATVITQCSQINKTFWVSQVVLLVKNLLANAGDMRHAGWIPGSGRAPGGKYGYLLQYSCLESPMKTGAGQAAVLRVTQSDTTEAT